MISQLNSTVVGGLCHGYMINLERIVHQNVKITITTKQLCVELEQTRWSIHQRETIDSTTVFNGHVQPWGLLFKAGWLAQAWSILGVYLHAFHHVVAWVLLLWLWTSFSESAPAVAPALGIWNSNYLFIAEPGFSLLIWLPLSAEYMLLDDKLESLIPE